MLPDKVKILRGKYTNKIGWFCCFTDGHPLSSEKRAQIRVYGLPDLPCMRTLLINESGYQVQTYREFP